MVRTDRRSPEAVAYRRMYKDKRWRGKGGIRDRRLAEEPLCRECRKRGHLTPATVVDHLKEHKGDPLLFFDYDNTQSLCSPCHDCAKQSEERRGFSSTIGPDGWPIDARHPAMATAPRAGGGRKVKAASAGTGAGTKKSKKPN
ncbi:HNH endonuclease signature motif containing protein [Filomicrobium sp.]|uniref:HNH endonuclease signature motif containing protein n=1 Tax=Filomicrobium sp. TaxID=2024831 RepID=UPI0025885261|nr:HNH endonuclease signature motif containing protein [Filomicrobium sp.]MCV0371087.1 HNH endonuclease [Filomicrobium sp.]